MTEHKPAFDCVILGGGGHAAVLIESIRARGPAVVLAVLDKNPLLWGRDILGVPVVGGDERLPEQIQQGTKYFVVGLGTAGTGRLRQQLYEYGLSCGLEPLAVYHPTAVVSPFGRLGAGCQLLPCSIVHTRAVLGRNVLVNTGAIVEHDCILGDHVHVATGAKLAGAVVVGDGAMVGVGASVRQGIRIGSCSVVGAGAVVVKDVPDSVVVVGVPARVIRGG